MAKASSANAKLGYLTEATWGTIPTAAMQLVPFLRSTLAHDKQTRESQQIRGDREIPDLVEVFASGQGEVEAELVYSAYNAFIESALFSVFNPQTYTGSGCVFEADDDSITKSSANWNAKFSVGQYIKISGATNAANNGFHKISAITSSKITCATSSFTDETVVGDITIVGSIIRNGVTQKSLVLEHEYTDITQFLSMPGAVADTMRINVTASEIVRAIWGFIGKQGEYGAATVGTGAASAASTNGSMNATAHVGQVAIGGTAVSCLVRSAEISVANQVRTRPAVGSRTSCTLGEGRVQVTGTIEAYFEDRSYLEAFTDHTSSSFHVRLFDAASSTGNAIFITLPKLYFAQGSIADIPGPDQDIMQRLNFQAVLDATTDCTIQIDTFAA
jgi:hypothetical protein